jgi:glutathione S-transferase
MITLYGFGRVHRKVIGETRDLRVEWALQETGLPYRVHPLDHTSGELSGDAYSRISCFHQVPAIDDEGFTVAESGAVLLYLAEKSAKLIPADLEGRTRVAQWCFAALTTVELPLAEIHMIDLMGGAGAEPRRADLVKWAGRVLGNLERRLEQRTWIACEDFTVADILLATVLRHIRATDLMDPYPGLKAYYQRALERPAWQRTLDAYSERLGVTVADIRKNGSLVVRSVG